MSREWNSEAFLIMNVDNNIATEKHRNMGVPQACLDMIECSSIFLQIVWINKQNLKDKCLNR